MSRIVSVGCTAMPWSQAQHRAWQNWHTKSKAAAIPKSKSKQMQAYELDSFPEPLPSPLRLASVPPRPSPDREREPELAPAPLRNGTALAPALPVRTEGPLPLSLAPLLF